MLADAVLRYELPDQFLGAEPQRQGFVLLAAFLDEFALWVRLKDVYWTDEGRSSLDAVVAATVFGGLVVLGMTPFELADATPGTSLVLTVAVDLALCVVVILKGKLLLALMGAFLPPLSIVGAVRLAKPGSPWAHRRYPARSPQAGARAGAP